MWHLHTLKYKPWFKDFICQLLVLNLIAQLASENLYSLIKNSCSHKNSIHLLKKCYSWKIGAFLMKIVAILFLKVIVLPTYKDLFTVIERICSIPILGSSKLRASYIPIIINKIELRLLVISTGAGCCWGPERACFISVMGNCLRASFLLGNTIQAIWKLAAFQFLRTQHIYSISITMLHSLDIYRVLELKNLCRWTSNLRNVWRWLVLYHWIYSNVILEI